MKLKVNLEQNPAGDKGQILNPANVGDAGYDLIACSNPNIQGSVVIKDFYRSLSYIEYDTNVAIEPNKVNGEYKFYSLMFPRSSISKYNLTMANSVGVIDSGYKNTIKVRFKYTIQPEDIYLLKEVENESNSLPTLKVNMNKIYKKGDRIAQLVFFSHFHPEISGLEKSIIKKDRGEGGFGSSGE